MGLCLYIPLGVRLVIIMVFKRNTTPFGALVKYEFDNLHSVLEHRPKWTPSFRNPCFLNTIENKVIKSKSLTQTTIQEGEESENCTLH